MDYIQFKLSLKKIRLTIKTFSSLTGNNPNGLNQWKKTGVPAYAISLLETLQMLSIEQRAGYIAQKIERL
ncbi:hypothetical protein ThvES_00008870 [Thiovulum sp. ES]|nr:hypothetical protein ThvES_00008870 [Thiovulum sp. ES]